MLQVTGISLFRIHSTSAQSRLQHFCDVVCLHTWQPNLGRCYNRYLPVLELDPCVRHFKSNTGCLCATGWCVQSTDESRRFSHSFHLFSSCAPEQVLPQALPAQQALSKAETPPDTMCSTKHTKHRAAGGRQHCHCYIPDLGAALS